MNEDFTSWQRLRLNDLGCHSTDNRLNGNDKHLIVIPHKNCLKEVKIVFRKEVYWKEEVKAGKKQV